MYVLWLAPPLVLMELKKDEKGFGEALMKMGARDDRRFEQNEAKRVAIFALIHTSPITK